MKNDQKDEPTIAPGMNTEEELEEPPMEHEKKTSVSHLYIDRTPEDD